METILNLTMHPCSPEQASLGVIEPDAELKNRIKGLLDFSSPPPYEEIERRARELAGLASGYHSAMIGGALWLMAPLESALLREGVVPTYAFSVRVSEEVTQPDGSVRKVNIFKHVGWVDVPTGLRTK